MSLCRSCCHREPVDGVWVAAPYEGALRQLIDGHKFGRQRAGHEPVADLIHASLPLLPSDIIVTSIPTLTHHVRIRGYDHARLIARRVARIRGYGCRPLLIRTSRARQLGANRQQRLRQAAEAFAVAGNTSVPRRVLVIDDVVTTGATIIAAASVLKRAGVLEVYVGVAGQTLRQRTSHDTKKSGRSDGDRSA